MVCHRAEDDKQVEKGAEMKLNGGGGSARLPVNLGLHVALMALDTAVEGAGARLAVGVRGLLA